MLTIELTPSGPRPSDRVHAELEEELAVLGLADLQERALVRDPDVVTLRVDEQEVGSLA